MIDRGKHNILGVRVDAVDYAAAVERIAEAAVNRRPLAVSALAVHGIMTGVLDSVQRIRLNNFDLVVPDGQPVRWALNLLHGTRLRERVYGPTLMLQTCEWAAAHERRSFSSAARRINWRRSANGCCCVFPDCGLPAIDLRHFVA